MPLIHPLSCFELENFVSGVSNSDLEFVTTDPLLFSYLSCNFYSFFLFFLFGHCSGLYPSESKIWFCFHFGKTQLAELLSCNFHKVSSIGIWTTVGLSWVLSTSHFSDQKESVFLGRMLVFPPFTRFSQCLKMKAIEKLELVRSEKLKKKCSTGIFIR